MRRPRISIVLIVLIVLVAVSGLLAMALLALSQRALHDNLALRYSWVPEGPQVPRGDPVYAEHVLILDTEQLSGALETLAVGASPLVSVLGLGVILSIYRLIVRGQFSSFLFGVLICGSAVLVVYLVASILVPRTIERFAAAPAGALARAPLAIAASIVPGLLDEPIKSAAQMLVLGLPMVLLALLGGWLNEKFVRVTLTVLPRRGADSASAQSPTPAS